MNFKNKYFYILTFVMLINNIFVINGYATLFEDKDELLSQINYIEEDAASPVLRALYNQGLISYGLNDFKNAAFYFNKILDIEKNYKNVKFLAVAMTKMLEYPVYEAKNIVISEYYEEGRQYYMNKNFLKAVTIWESILVLNPEQSFVIQTSVRDARNLLAKPYYDQGWTFYKNGAYEDAIDQWEQVLALDPTYVGLRDLLDKTKEKARVAQLSALFDEATSLYKENKFTQSLDKVRQILKADPTNTAALSLKKSIAVTMEKFYYTYFNQGLENYKLAKYEVAISNFKLASSYVANNTQKQEVMEYMQKARYELAIRDSNKPKAKQKVKEVALPVEAVSVKEVNVQEVRNHYNKGLYYYKNGYFEKAIYEWEIVLNLDPENERAYTSLQRAKSALKNK